MAKGLLICGHGSRKQLGVDRFIGFAEKIIARHTDYIGTYAFMEISQPDFETGIKKLYDQGAREIIALPAFLFSGVHMQNDIPNMLKAFEHKYEGLNIKLASYVGVNQHLIDLAIKRIEEAEAALGNDYTRQDSILLPVAVGTSVPKANGDIANINYQLWEQTRFGHMETAFINSLAFPKFGDILNAVKDLPQKRIVLQIMILFEGIYHDKIRHQIKKFNKVCDKEVIITEPLGHDELLFAAIDDRLAEVEQGLVDLCAGIDPHEAAHHGHHHHDHDHGHGHSHSHHNH